MTKQLGNKVGTRMRGPPDGCAVDIKITATVTIPFHVSGGVICRELKQRAILEQAEVGIRNNYKYRCSLLNLAFCGHSPARPRRRRRRRRRRARGRGSSRAGKREGGSGADVCISAVSLTQGRARRSKRMIGGEEDW